MFARKCWWSIRWKRFFAHVGAGAWINRPLLLTGVCSIALDDHVFVWEFSRLEARNATAGTTRLRIGRGTIIHPFVHIGAAENVLIGNEVLIASGVYITDHDHDFGSPSSPAISNRRIVTSPVTIGNHVWLGERVIVLKGVDIGEHTIVGAGSIVTQSIPAYSIAVGAPARVIRRFDQEIGHWVPA